MVAVRRLDLAGAKRLRRDFRGRVVLAGAVIAFLLTIPPVNLVTPMIAHTFLVRTSVVEGKRLSLRVLLGCRRRTRKNIELRVDHTTETQYTRHTITCSV